MTAKPGIGTVAHWKSQPVIPSWSSPVSTIPIWKSYSRGEGKTTLDCLPRWTPESDALFTRTRHTGSFGLTRLLLLRIEGGGAAGIRYDAKYLCPAADDH
jgi:hypothetical protein